jgi:hypothetical protein
MSTAEMQTESGCVCYCLPVSAMLLRRTALED